MAYADNTLNGLIQMNDKNLADIEVTDLLQDAPALNALYAVLASNGTLHKYLKQTVAAGAGFRAVNVGIANAAPQEELVTDTLQVLDASFSRDKAIALAFKGGKDAYMEKEMVKAMKAAFAQAEAQIFYGTGNDAAGFSGIANTLDKLTDSMVVNATGTGSGTVKTSVFVVRSTDADLAVVLGQDGVIDVGDIYEGTVLDGSTNPYSVLGINILGYLGLQLGSNYSAARIVNITDESGKGLTDDLIAKALALFPSSRQATHIIMNRTARMMLQQSRTATNPTGAPAPFPDSAFNVPIITTDALSTSESIVTT